MKNYLLKITTLCLSGFLMASCSGGGGSTTSASKSNTSSSSTTSETSTFVLTVINGEGSGTFDPNSEVTVIAKPDISKGEWFDHWEINGTNVSTSKTYSFTITANTTITAVMNSDEEMKEYANTVYMSGDNFKILNLTDVQLHNGDDLTLTKHIIQTLVDQEDPDMITLLGDIINDDTSYDVDVAARNIVEYIDSFDIPWAPIFGNHDNVEYHPEGTKKTKGVEYLMDLFAECENCLFIKGPDGVLGKSNYMVNVVNQANGGLVETLVFLDSYTHGLDSTNVDFYEDCIEFANKLNDGNTAKSIVFDHIPIKEYLTAYQHSQSIEFHDIVGGGSRSPLAAGEGLLFDKIKELGSTKTIICGHDHENAYYVDYQGIRLAYAMKSSDGDDEAGVSYLHPLGGLMLTIDGTNEILRYTPVTDITGRFTNDFAYHPFCLSFWRYQEASLEFDIDLPSSGSVQFALMGTNLSRSSVPYDDRVGCWNRLTENFKIDAGAKTVPVGSLTQVSGNKYHYSCDVTEFNLNKDSGEEAYGEETLRLVYFHDAGGNQFGITNLHFDIKEVPETDQADLANAVLTPATIPDQNYTKMPIKPEPKVELGGSELKKMDDIIYSYEDNINPGVATLRIIPSGKGSHKYKGEKVITFNIVGQAEKGDKFTGGTDYTLDLKNPVPVSSGTITFDLKITTGSDTHINVMFGDGWSHYFGYFEINSSTGVGAYNGLTSVTTLADGYTRYVFTLNQITKEVNDDDKKSHPEYINLFYIRGNWTTADGFVLYVE